MAEEPHFATKELEAAADGRLLEPGHWALLWFERDTVWHQRLLLLPSKRDKSFFVCMTPDEQIYEEAPLETNPEDWAVRSFGCRNFSDHPPEVTQEICGFEGEPSAASIKKSLAGGKAEARRLLAKRGEELSVEPLCLLYDAREKVRHRNDG